MTMARITTLGFTSFAVVDVETGTELVRFDNFNDAKDFIEFFVVL